MKAAELLTNIQLDHTPNPSAMSVHIGDISCDSREVEQGTLFVAVPGHTTDGHNYIDSAVERGASLVIGEKEITNADFPYIQVKDSRKALAQIAKAFYLKDKPLPKMIGITGTNGKTTTTYMLKSIFEQAGYSCATFGTVSYIINKEAYPSSNSTPGPLTLYKLLAQSNDDVAILEVSSHGIRQGRVHGLYFDHLVFTNLAHDHLDYHGSMEDYFETKASLFQQLKTDGKAVIYTGQGWGKQLSDRLKDEGKQVYTVNSSEQDDVIVKPEQNYLIVNGEQWHLSLQMPGVHNFHNASFAAYTSYLAGIDWNSITDTLARKLHVPGRFEEYRHPKGATIIVDYAHTADALENIFHTAKKEGAKRIVHIFGFRGGRDQTKRKEMLKVSASNTSRYILTGDDLYGETPATMEKELYDLHKHYGNSAGKVMYDRTKAIKSAWDQARPGDWIIITGKGHETYEQVYKYPVDSDINCIRYLDRFTRNPQKKLIQS
ncbi:UDP-N-acetylmuramoyl-L-alanyl-D-glutamate--2,6-diaminopimelate ligase [Thalassobacillus devorans]|uniref:UDP-N-acetylmuramoyl-L-alanyl-D-glutamate--2, 6-diaminopimelate ligase n=1 Tax=Thalassobacillus devorans TaxID=279813 RepID=A0ABQ1NPQ8_9BACI|nr:UDP-N-acetylmuramoyl-L-alanyl-D-glutamate--2,6-diaminopimelate ligase [Thalassobacillus devorans]NIK29007.1 UDP-N-acetylmuramoyl-L-alanyl-D-glutamate--2,6-diaminopimelate ligase [Thalassobacillus devorans]GGC81878.1 UDP-N-acetylmuramoyl-L-alanyl-D-glutamate--2,6-diaminopimelate ligase [Thalassobacillus devorans]